MATDYGLGRVSGELQVEAPVANLILPKQFFLKLKAGATTPSVANIEKVRTAGSAVTITDFLNGQEGQSIDIVGDGLTTIANNTNIKTNTAANKILAANKVYRFTLNLGVWIEQEGGTTTVGGGSGLTFPFIPPATANAMDEEGGGTTLNGKWSWINQGTSTVTVGNGVLILAAPASGTDSNHLLVQAAPTAPYTIEAAFVPSAFTGNYSTIGLVLYNSGNSKLETYGITNNTLLKIERWTNTTTWSSTFFTTGGGTYYAGATLLIRLVVSSTTVILQTSFNGFTWYTHSTSTLSSFLIAITHVGLSVNSSISGNPAGVSLLLRYFRKVA